jgi:phage protein D
MAVAEAIRGLQSSRPAVEIAGQADSSLTQGLITLLIHESVSGIYRCEAQFGNLGPENGTVDFLYFDRRTLDFGKALAIRLDQDSIFDGKIYALEAQYSSDNPPTITALAEDRLQDLRMTRRTRTFEDMSDADVFGQIASDHGLTAEADFDGPSHRVLAQANQSDLAFLRSRGRASGVEVWVEGSTLKAKRRSDRREDAGELVLGADLKDFRVLADLAQQRTSVTVSGWDVAAKESIAEEATSSAIQSEAGGDETGVSILESAFGARKESLTHAAAANGGEARAMAEAAFATLARRFVVGRGTASAAAGLRVGKTVNLRGLGPLFSGVYYLSEVTHLFDQAHGLRTEFVAERPGIGRP